MPVLPVSQALEEVPGLFVRALDAESMPALWVGREYFAHFNQQQPDPLFAGRVGYAFCALAEHRTVGARGHGQPGRRAPPHRAVADYLAEADRYAYLPVLPRRELNIDGRPAGTYGAYVLGAAGLMRFAAIEARRSSLLAPEHAFAVKLGHSLQAFDISL